MPNTVLHISGAVVHGTASLMSRNTQSSGETEQARQRDIRSKCRNSGSCVWLGQGGDQEGFPGVFDIWGES